MRDQLFEIQDISPKTIVRVGVGVIVRGPCGILLEKRADCQKWGLVGGRIEPGEAIKETALREVYEETGLQVDVKALLGVYSEPYCRLLRFEPSGDERHIIDVVVIADVKPGPISLRCSEESTELCWFTLPATPPECEFLSAAWKPVQDYWAGASGVLG